MVFPELPLPKSMSQQSIRTNLTIESKRSRSTVNPIKLSGLRNEFMKLAVKGSKITSTSSRGKSTDLQRMEGISIDKNDNGSEIPAIITDN